MGFNLPKPNLPLLVVAMGAMILSARAQQAGQPIIFSSPQSDAAQSVTPSLIPQNSLMPVLPGTLQAPVSPFDASASSDLQSLPPPANASGQQQMNKLMEERKDWTLMTPAEIFGVTTAEKLLQKSERDATGQERNPTQLERYLDRENQARAGSTNDWQNDKKDSPWNFTRDQDGANPFDRSRYDTGDPAQNLDRFLNGRRNIDVSQNQGGVVNWDSFNTSSQTGLQKTNFEQVAAMERFRQLLDSSSAAAPSPDNSFFPVPKTVVDPNITQPDFVPNPAGASFIPLTSGAGKPTGLTPLPGIVTSTLKPVSTPAWAPQPPPWLLQGPQPFAMPQQKF